MLRRLASGAAIVAVALALAGCTPPEPTDDEAVAEATATLSEFYAIVEGEFERGEASPEQFSSVATPGFAETYAGDVQALIDQGYVSRGVPVLSNVKLLHREAGTLVIRFCSDATEVRTTSRTGVEVNGQVLEWSADIEVDEAEFLISDMIVTGDDLSC